MSVSLLITGCTVLTTAKFSPGEIYYSVLILLNPSPPPLQSLSRLYPRGTQCTWQTFWTRDAKYIPEGAHTHYIYIYIYIQQCILCVCI